MSSKIAQLEDALRAQGQPLTTQRRVILEALEDRTDHPTADQVYKRVHAQLPSVSKTTVYRTLDVFVELGVIRRVDHPGASARFDPRTEHHHHLVCDICGVVADYAPKKEEAIKLPGVRETGFTVTGYSVHFTGVCPDCRK